jgi:hypothetical protein
MHEFVKKGLLVSLATGVLLLGGAGFAAADTATVNGSTAGNEGFVAGNVAQVAGNNPINVCGDTADLGTAYNRANANSCASSGNLAGINGASSHSSGAITGNVIGAAVDTPVQVCGVAAEVASVHSGAVGNTCADTGTSATAYGSANDDSGLLTGNVIQLSEHAPISVCGDSVGILGFESGAIGNSCSNS